MRIFLLYMQIKTETTHIHTICQGYFDLTYNQAKSMKKLTNICNKTLESYNESNAAMNLVLFEDAVKHVCRISRIISSASGHCLSVGVGGSGSVVWHAWPPLA